MSNYAQLVFMAVALAGSFLYRKHLASKTASSWKTAADLIDGRFEPSDGALFSPTSAHVYAEIEGVEVHADHYTVSHGRSSSTYTRITAPARVPPGFTLKIYAGTFLSTVGKAIGAQDVEVGDREFDDAFVVKTSDEGMARVWISRELRKVSFSLKAYSLTLEAGQVTSTRDGLEVDAEQLVLAVRQAAILATQGERLVDRWRALAKRLDGDTDAEELVWPGGAKAAIRAEHGGVLITITITTSAALQGSTKIDTTVSAATPAAHGEPFAIRRRSPQEKAGADPFNDPAFFDSYVLEASDPSKAFRRFNDELRRRILALEPKAITSSEAGVTLALDGAVFTRKVIEPAMAIVAELAAAKSEGPYC